MSIVRAVLIVAAVSLVSAGLVAFVSRTPADVRTDKPGPEATDPSLGARFSDRQIHRHAAYRGPSYLSWALGTVIEISLLVALARGPFRRLIDSLEGVPGGWVTRAALAAAVVVMLAWIAQLPLSYVRGYSVAHAWGLSTQDLGGWAVDHLKSLLVAMGVAAVAAIAFFGSVRLFPRTWWLVGWVVFTGLSVLFALVWPVAIAPLFNRFTPVEDPALKERVLSLASAAGVVVDDVLVADASRRTTTENAYVAGLGGTKRVVLYDTLVRSGDENETAYVVAHELGHEAESHVIKGLAAGSVGLLAGFAGLALLASRDGPWRWGGSSGADDVASLPLLLIYLTVATLVLLPVQSAVSRHFERQADSIAVRLTEDPDTAVSVFRRLAFSNLSDLRPHPLAVWALYSHPPIGERIRSALEAE